MTTYSFGYFDAGLRVGFSPWRDSVNPQFVYHLRNTNFNDVVDDAFQLVKINVTTGAYTTGPQWLYADNYGDFGACYVTPTAIHSAGVNLTSSPGTNKLYLFGSSGFGAGPYDHVVIEFDKTTLDVTDSWVVGPVGTDVVSRDRGNAVTSYDGLILANAGNSDRTASTFTTSYIDLFRPSDGAYNRVELNGDLGITGLLGLYFYYHAPICFDHNGFLWFITAPWVDGGLRSDRSTAASTLYKCSVNVSLDLVIEDSFAIADNFYAYAAGVGPSQSFAESVGYARMVCNPTLKKLYLFVDWRLSAAGDTEEGWFFEFDLQSETFTRGPIDWTGGQYHDVTQKIDSIGFTEEDFIVTWLHNGGTSTAKFIVFQMSTGIERQYSIESNFTFSVDLSDATLFHSFVDDADDYIYAMDIDFHTVDGWQIYRDGLFIIAQPDGGGGPPVTISLTGAATDVNIEGL